MKKTMVVLLVASLALAALPAFAEEAQSGVAYSGKVAYGSTLTVTAPFGGTLADYSLQPGDNVMAGDSLFKLKTTTVYAPIDGTVRGLRALPGDDAAVVNERYGALLYLEPVGKYTLNATTANAYDNDNTHNRNRYLNEGETVYLRSSDNNDRTGIGTITTVDGRNFTVEVQQSNLDMEDTVSIYRDADYSTTQRIASRARVQRAETTAVAPEGSVLRCLVSEGDAVKRGDALFEMVTGTLKGLMPASNTVSAPVNGVILTTPNAAGSAVAKDDVLATLYAVDDLRVEFDLDEGDLDVITPGSRVTVKLDSLPDREPISGTITAVATVPDAAGEDVTYTAYVALDSVANLRVGMSTSVYMQ